MKLSWMARISCKCWVNRGKKSQSRLTPQNWVGRVNEDRIVNVLMIGRRGGGGWDSGLRLGANEKSILG